MPPIIINLAFNKKSLMEKNFFPFQYLYCSIGRKIMKYIPAIQPIGQ